MASIAVPLPASTPAPNRALITASVILATVLQVLDTTIANVALPHMQAALGANRETITWVLTSYIVAAAIATPITGWLSDRVGQKRLFLIAIGGFVGASMLCGAATSLPMMVIVRAVQGIFGAFLVPIAQTVLLDAYPKEKHGQAMGLWGAAIMAAPVLGPVLGGWLTDNYSWRWVFYVNLPVGVLAFAGAWASLREPARRMRRFDLFGFALLGFALAGLQLMLDRGPQLDWFESGEVIAEAAIAGCAAWMLAIHLLFSRRERVFDPAMFSDRNYLAACSFGFIAGLVMTAGAALLPPMLQQLYGYPTVSAGLLMAPRGVGTVAAFIITARINGKVDARLIILGGFACIAFSLWQMTGFSLEMGSRLVVTSGFIQGAGMGFAMGPLLTLGFATLNPRFRTEASSLFSLLRGLGGSTGVAIVTAVLARNVQVSHSDLAMQVTQQSAAGQLLAVVGGNAGPANAMLDGEINRQALMIAYLDDYRLMMLLTLAAVPLLLFVRRPPKPAGGAPHAVME